MTDAHCHVVRDGGRHLVCRTPEEGAEGVVPGRDALFIGIHPWQAIGVSDADCFRAERLNPFLDEMRQRLADGSGPLGVGEIGLDRLKERTISPLMREVFAAQLDLAAEFVRPVVLHGAKCWGEVVRACLPYAGRIPAFLFHGFSRSGGLLPDIVRLNGFISVGPAVLNDHAVNYRELVKSIPLDRLLVETDATEENAQEVPRIEEVALKVAEVRGVPFEELVPILDRTAGAFVERM